MSDMGPEPSGDQPSGDQPSSPKPARGDDLGLLAIEEQFAEAYHAGAGPRLSAYLLRYPQYMDELTTFVSAFLPEAALDTGDVAHEASSPPPSPGVQRALDAILAGLDRQPRAHGALWVAEARTPYATVPLGLVGLAHAHGLPLEKLAECTDLSPETLAGVDRMALAPKDLPPILMQCLADALGIREEEVTWETAHVSSAETAKGSTPVRTSPLYELLTTHPSLSPEQRLRWRTLLSGDERR